MSEEHTEVESGESKSLVNIDFSKLAKPATVLIEKVSSAVGCVLRNDSCSREKTSPHPAHYVYLPSLALDLDNELMQMDLNDLESSIH